MKYLLKYNTLKINYENLKKALENEITKLSLKIEEQREENIDLHKRINHKNKQIRELKTKIIELGRK